MSEVRLDDLLTIPPFGIDQQFGYRVTQKLPGHVPELLFRTLHVLFANLEAGNEFFHAKYLGLSYGNRSVYVLPGPRVRSPYCELKVIEDEVILQVTEGVDWKAGQFTQQFNQFFNTPSDLECERDDSVTDRLIVRSSMDGFDLSDDYLGYGQSDKGFYKREGLTPPDTSDD